MRDGVLRRIGDYVAATVLAAGAVGIRLLFPGFFGEGNWFIQMHPAVFLAAWLGGTGPGLLATTLGSVAAAYYFVPPPSALPISRLEVQLTLTAAAIGCVISVLTGALRRSRTRALAAQRDAQAVREEYARLLDEAQRASHAKDEFLATLSHELRTPLNVALGWLHLLRRDEVPEPQRPRVLETIFQNTLAQMRLVEDVLDLSSMVTGQLTLSSERIDLGELTRTTCETMATAFAAKQQSVEVKTDDRPLVVLGDPVRLRQVLWNLLSNASKFTPAGGRVSVAVSARDGVLLSVTDTGIGIEPEFLAHIFESFRQADNTPTRVHGGLGLGLALVRRLVEAHGGSVCARSEGLGRGTTIEVRLPCAPTE